jgi:hypothetical protein
MRALKVRVIVDNLRYKEFATELADWAVDTLLDEDAMDFFKPMMDNASADGRLWGKKDDKVYEEGVM